MYTCYLYMGLYFIYFQEILTKNNWLDLRGLRLRWLRLRWLRLRQRSLINLTFTYKYLICDNF